MTVVPRLVFAAALAVLVAFPSRPAAQATPGIARSVHVNTFDEKGDPVEDLAPADFVVKEGGKAREVRAYHPASGLMQIALIVDDNGTGLFRAPLYRFGQPLKLTDYTMDARVLSEALGGLSVRPATPDGGQLLQGIYEAATDLEKREARRPVIIALSVPGEEHKTLPARHVLDKLKDSGASLHVFLVAGSAGRPMANVTKPSALLEENMNLGEVLADGSKQSGGTREDIVASAGGLIGLQRLAEDLLHQYVIDYDLPPGTKPSDRISITVKRKGVSVRAPARIPNR
jgi:hypothetical protein